MGTTKRRLPQSKACFRKGDTEVNFSSLDSKVMHELIGLGRLFCWMFGGSFVIMALTSFVHLFVK